MFNSTSAQIRGGLVRYSGLVQVEKIIESRVGSVSRRCGWPPCDKEVPLLDGWANRRGRMPIYCSIACRLKTAKRKRDLHAAVALIDAEAQTEARVADGL